MLAALPDAEVERAIAIHGAALAQNWSVGEETIRDLVKTTRKQGYSYVVDIFVPGMAAIGVALTGSDGVPFAAFSIASVPPRLQGERRANVVSWLQNEARFVAELNSASCNLQVI
jgi:DNA-binding IclR family transcriptional regulator